MRLLSPTITMEGSSTNDPFQQLEGVYSTSSNPVYQGGTNTSVNTTASTTYLGEYVDPIIGESILTNPVITTPVLIPTNNVVASNTGSTNSTNSTSQGISMGSGISGSSSEVTNNTSFPKKESLIDKWKNLPDWKKGLIILAVATGSYYGYQKLNK